MLKSKRGIKTRCETFSIFKSNLMNATNYLACDKYNKYINYYKKISTLKNFHVKFCIKHLIPNYSGSYSQNIFRYHI